MLVMKDNFDNWHTVFFNQLHIFSLLLLRKVNEHGQQS